MIRIKTNSVINGPVCYLLRPKFHCGLTHD